MTIKSYSELRRFTSYDDRFDYLKLKGDVGRATFGFDRYINQKFYSSYEWKQTRQTVILRDRGCDLGVSGYEITGGAVIHHMNPMSADDIIHGEDWIFDPEYLIMTASMTHNAIHFGNKANLPKVVTARSPNDTKLW